MTDDTTDDTTQVSEAEQQLTLDQADTAAGYRAVIDDDEQLDPTDPNRAADHGDDEDHEALAGDEVDDEDTAAVANAVAERDGTR